MSASSLKPPIGIVIKLHNIRSALGSPFFALKEARGVVLACDTCSTSFHHEADIGIKRSRPRVDSPTCLEGYLSAGPSSRDSNTPDTFANQLEHMTLRTDSDACTYHMIARDDAMIQEISYPTTELASEDSPKQMRQT